MLQTVVKPAPEVPEGQGCAHTGLCTHTHTHTHKHKHRHPYREREGQRGKETETKTRQRVRADILFVHDPWGVAHTPLLQTVLKPAPEVPEGQG